MKIKSRVWDIYPWLFLFIVIISYRVNPMESVLNSLNNSGLSTDAMAIIISVLMAFYFFKQVIYYMIDRHEKIIKVLSESYMQSLSELKLNFSDTLDRIEKRNNKSNDKS